MIKHEIRDKNGGTRTVKLTPLKAIKLFCQEAFCWTAHEVKNCTSPICPLYPYRLGRNPERTGKGGKGVRFEKK